MSFYEDIDRRCYLRVMLHHARAAVFQHPAVPGRAADDVEEGRGIAARLGPEGHEFGRRNQVDAGGLGLLHTIGKEKHSFRDPWTMTHIFPGAYIPNLPEVALQLAKRKLSLLDVENLRLHYARTLDWWAANFERNLDLRV